jgi:hypothetical protein
VNGRGILSVSKASSSQSRSGRVLINRIRAWVPGSSQQDVAYPIGRASRPARSPVPSAPPPVATHHRRRITCGSWGTPLSQGSLYDMFRVLSPAEEKRRTQEKRRIRGRGGLRAHLSRGGELQLLGGPGRGRHLLQPELLVRHVPAGVRGAKGRKAPRISATGWHAFAPRTEADIVDMSLSGGKAPCSWNNPERVGASTLFRARRIQQHAGAPLTPGCQSVGAPPAPRPPRRPPAAASGTPPGSPRYRGLRASQSEHHRDFDRMTPYPGRVKVSEALIR